jgi:hypothetical protein
MTPPSAVQFSSAAEGTAPASDVFGHADMARLLGRAAPPVAPLAMPLQPLEGTLGSVWPRLVASIPLRSGN